MAADVGAVARARVKFHIQASLKYAVEYNVSLDFLTFPIIALINSLFRYRGYTPVRCTRKTTTRRKFSSGFDSVSLSPDMQICNNPNTKSLKLAQ